MSEPKYIDMGSYSYCNLPHLQADLVFLYDPAYDHLDYVLHTDGIWYTNNPALEDWDEDPPVELWNEGSLGSWPFGDPIPTALVEVVTPSEWDSTLSSFTSESSIHSVDPFTSGSDTSLSGSSSSWVLDPTSSVSSDSMPDLLTPPPSSPELSEEEDHSMEGALAFAQGLIEHLEDPDGASFWDAYDNNYSF